ncbi:archaetidylserine decarboxylase [Candidatus Rickettsiella viridis]|uniref:archaetidylserine decarboxylase n=1 Tax=Candidatus Rickettsiella viridis TaxID=676208 RepID=UPI000F82F62A|nr:archaetidylserine decarboxylase [Candidatus Rickettsiella viridis]
MRTLFQSFLPQHGLSRFAGWVAHCKQPWIKNRLIKNFIRDYQVDMSLALKESPNDYSHFNEFFTRALKPEKRPIDSGSEIIVSPVDGCVSQFGDIREGQLLQAKKINYSLQALLGGSMSLASRFQQGKFATFYLSPKDYHRVHSPFVGTLQEMIYVPGRLFSVNTETTEQLSQLFVRNERVICLFSTPIGPMAVILVGAMLVASMSTVWEGVITPAKTRQIRHWHYVENTVSLAKGEELGQFQLGSTVIVLFAANRMQWSDHLALQSKVQFGEGIGRVLS